MSDGTQTHERETMAGYLRRVDLIVCASDEMLAFLRDELGLTATAVPRATVETVTDRHVLTTNILPTRLLRRMKSCTEVCYRMGYGESTRGMSYAELCRRYDGLRVTRTDQIARFYPDEAL